MGAGVLTAATPPFARRGGVLHCGACSLEVLAQEYYTPLYVYNGDRIVERKRTLVEAFAGPKASPVPLVAYSVKANPNLAVLELLAREGAGADIVSGGELYRALRAGIPADRIVFAGVGKSPDEMRYGIEAGIRSFHVESAQELEALGALAAEMGAVAPVAVRVNPDVDSFTHEFTSTGHAAAKFGVSPGGAHEMYRRVAGHPALRAVGVDVHIGSQIRDAAPFLRALDVVLGVEERARREHGIELDYVDLGGGFGIADGAGDALDVHALGRAVAGRLQGRGLDMILEPGRFLVGDAGVLVTRVLYVTPSRRSPGARRPGHPGPPPRRLRGSHPRRDR